MKKTNPRKAPQSALPPELRPFAMIPRDVLRSDAWRSLGINERRVIDFLLLEYLSKGGRENSKLKAPYRQLVNLGIGARYVASAIAGVEQRGLIACYRGGLRVASVYTIAWLPLPDGSMPTQGWRAVRTPNLHHKGNAGLHHNGNADGRTLHHKGNADRPENLHSEGDALSRYTSNHAATDSIGECGSPAVPEAGRPAARAAAGVGR